MSSLLLPPQVAREIHKKKWAEQRREYRAKLELLFDFDDPTCREWNPQLKNLDPALRMGRAKPLAYEPGWCVRPGFYHWLRDNETAPPTVTAITGPDGKNFTEPSSGLLEDLKRCDLQDPRVFAALLARREQVERAEEQAMLTEREERQREIMERWAAVSRTQVSMNTDTPWGQNAAGARKARRKS